MFFSHYTIARRQKRKQNRRKSVRIAMQIRCGRWNSRETQNSTDSRRRIEKIIHEKNVLFTEDFHHSCKLSRSVFHSSTQIGDDERQRVRFIQIKMLIMKLNLISRKICSKSVFLLVHFLYFGWSIYLSEVSHVAVMIFQSIGWFKWHNKLSHYKYNIENFSISW